MKIFSVEEIQSIEKEANQKGLTYEVMMENAGRGLAKEIELAYSHIIPKKVIGLIGSGNNGGDALIALTHLALTNWETCAYIVRSRNKDDVLINNLRECGGQIVKMEEDKEFIFLEQIIESFNVLIDGVYGTGIKFPLPEETSQVLSIVSKVKNNRNNNIKIVAVDCPSGMNCDTGQVAVETIPADLTVTMAGIKTGMIKFPAANYLGDIRVTSIGSIEPLNSYRNVNKYLLTRDDIKVTLPKRALDSHKGTFGTALIISGSINYTGASFFAGMASYRIGTGLVIMAVPAPIHSSLAGSFPEATWITLPDKEGAISSVAVNSLGDALERSTALLIGPGFGLAKTTSEFFRKLIVNQFGTYEKNESNNEFIEKNVYRATDIPIVIDADGLKLIVKIDKWFMKIPSFSVLTPHPGEMAVMTGLSVKEIQQDRIGIAQRFSALWDHVVVLKGAYTVIAEPNGNVAVVPIATPALAKAGTGDILAGLIVGLLAQRVSPFQAACASAWIHGKAGLLAAKKMGNTASVLASDILREIPHVISELEAD